MAPAPRTMAALVVAAGATAVAGQILLRDLIAQKEALVGRIAARAEALWAARCPNATMAAAACDVCAAWACRPGASGSAAAVCAPAYEFGYPAACAAGGVGAPPGRLVDFSASSVTLAADTDDARADVCAFAGMDPTFQANAAGDRLASVQAFSAASGVVRRFPGVSGRTASGGCPSRDPRLDESFVSAASGPKNVVIVLDTSGSMAEQGRLAQAKAAAGAVLAGLGPTSHVGVVSFSTAASARVNPWLVPATVANKAALQRAIDALTSGGGTNFTAAFTAAFAMLNATAGRGAGALACSGGGGGGGGGMDPGNTAVVFLSDGEPTPGTWDPAAFVRGLTSVPQAVPRPRVFAYAFGSGISIATMREVACASGGVAQRVGDGEDLPGTMARYYGLYAAGAHGAGGTPSWSNPWVDPDGGGNTTTAALPVYDRSVSPPALVGVASLDVRVAELTNGTGCAPDAALGALWARSAACPGFAMSPVELQAYRARVDACGVCPAPEPLPFDGFQWPAGCAPAGATTSPSGTASRTPSPSTNATRSGSPSPSAPPPPLAPACAALVARPPPPPCDLNASTAPPADVVAASCCAGTVDLPPNGTTPRGTRALPLCAWDLGRTAPQESRYGACGPVRSIPDDRAAALLCVSETPTGTPTPSPTPTASLSPWVVCDNTTTPWGGNGSSAGGGGGNGTLNATGAPLCFFPIVVPPAARAPTAEDASVVPLAVGVPLGVVALVGGLLAALWARRRGSTPLGRVAAGASPDQAGAGVAASGAQQHTNAFYRREELARVKALPLPQPAAAASARAPTLSTRGNVQLESGWWHAIGAEPEAPVTEDAPGELPPQLDPMRASTRSIRSAGPPQLDPVRGSTRSIRSAGPPLDLAALAAQLAARPGSMRLPQALPQPAEAGPGVGGGNGPSMMVASARAMVASMRRSARMQPIDVAAAAAAATPPQAPGSTWKERARAAVAQRRAPLTGSPALEGHDFVYAYVGSSRLVMRNPAAGGAGGSPLWRAGASMHAFPDARGRSESPHGAVGAMGPGGSHSAPLRLSPVSAGGLGRAVTSLAPAGRGLVEPAMPLRRAPLRAVSGSPHGGGGGAG